MKHFIFISLIFILFSSCGASKNKNSGTKTKLSITSVEWRLISVKDRDTLLATGNAPNPATLKINSYGHVSGSSGCNNFFGQAEIKDKNIKFGKMGLTKKLCTDMSIETAYLNAFNEIDAFEIKSGKLNLKKGKSVIATFTTFR
ncbi:MAG: META domain-containing protein [Prevotellaceae bacterium]|jgi:heat shock protein HslJ|nr:META domain-containing protein [Prevotellaceae bacterium]